MDLGYSIDLSGETDLTDGKGGVYKKLVRPGDDGELPPHGANVTVHYEGFLQTSGALFDSSRLREEPFTFKLGLGQVIEGWDIAVASMRPGEFAMFTVRADYAYGWEGKPPKIPVDAMLRFEIELLSWSPGEKEVYDMNAAEKLEHGQKRRDDGTRLLKAGDFGAAASAFEGGMDSLSALRLQMLSSAASDDSRLPEVTTPLVSCLLNHAQCKLKLEEWKPCVESCTKVLAIDSRNLKALYRRGVARTALELFDEAKEDLRAACELEPNNREVRAAFAKAKDALAAHKQAERQAFSGMFGSTAYFSNY